MRLPFLLFILLHLALGSYSQNNFPIAPHVPTEIQNEKAAQPRSEAPKTLQQFADGLMLKSVISNSNPVKNELVQVRWVLYYPNSPKLSVDYKITDYSLPNLPDFVKEWNIIVDEDDAQSVQSVQLNGMNYRARTLLCFYMLPVDVGSFSLSKGSLSIKLYDGNGAAFGQPVSLVSKARSINVSELNNLPDAFSGAIGQFCLTSELSNTDSIFCGKPFVYRLRVSGSGNFKFINSPQISFPDGFEVHPLQPTNHVSYNVLKCEGEKVFDYYITAKSPGSYSIPEASISLYNPALKKYQVAKCEPIRIDVHPFASSTIHSPTEQSSIPNDSGLSKEQNEGSSPFIFILLFIVVLGLICLLFYKRISEKQTKASSADFEELALAAMMEANSTLHGEDFYKKVIDLTLDYISNKLNYRVATQSKMVLADILSENGISKHKVERVIYLIDYCEQVCYSQSRDFSNKEMVNDLFCDVIDDLKVDFDKSVNCCKLQ